METLKECRSYYPLIANPVSHAAEGNLLNFEAVTLSLAKAKKSWCLLPQETSLRTTEL